MMRVKASILAATACALWPAIPMAAAMRSAWPSETLSGKIAMVEPDRNLVVVKTSSGVPFDIVVSAKTRIESAFSSAGKAHP